MRSKDGGLAVNGHPRDMFMEDDTFFYRRPPGGFVAATMSPRCWPSFEYKYCPQVRRNERKGTLLGLLGTSRPCPTTNPWPCGAFRPSLSDDCGAVMRRTLPGRKEAYLEN